MAFKCEYTRQGKKRWVIVWQDARRGKGKKGRRTFFCDVHGVTNEKERIKRLKVFQQLEDKYKEEEEKGIIEEQDWLISEAIEEYLKIRKKELEIRRKRKGREGIAENTMKIINNAIDLFKNFCKEKRISNCKDITPLKLSEFKPWLLLKKVKCSAYYLNIIIRNIKTFFYSFEIHGSSVFENIQALTSTLKAFKTSSELTFYFEVEELQSVLQSALQHDTELCTFTREMHDAGKSFKGKLPLRNVPIFPTLVLIMLTGMRKNEALSLIWKNINLRRGSITVDKAQKTGKSRKIPLITVTNDRIISPTLLELLKVWKEKSKDKYVLPHEKSDKPSELKKPLTKFKRKYNFPNLKYQNFRKTFFSYVISVGIPPFIAAFWAGHSIAIAEKNYVEFTTCMFEGKSIEEAMGISQLLKQAVEGFKGKGKYKNLAKIKWE